MTQTVSISVPYNGRTNRFTVPSTIKGTCTAYLWGAGGGAGGGD